MTHPSEGVPSAIRSGGGRRPRITMAMFQARWSETPSELDRKTVAAAAGLDSVDDVPDYFATKADLVLWLLDVKVMRGEQWALSEVMDRLWPKPRRMEVSGPEGGPLRSVVSTIPPTEGEAAEARAYAEALRSHGEGEG